MIIDTHVHIGGRFENAPNSWASFKDYQELSKELNTKFIGMSCDLSPDYDYIKQNQETLKEIRKDKNIFAGMYLFVNPNKNEIKDIEKQITPEVKGFKILRYSEHPDFDKNKLKKIIKLAEEKNLVVMFHTGYGSEATKWAKYAVDFPDANFLLAHFGGPSPDLQKDGINAIQMSENIYLETTFAQCYLNSIEKVIDLGFENRIVFGSDYPLHNMKALVAAMKAHDFEEKIYNKIMFDNANKLFKLELK